MRALAFAAGPILLLALSAGTVLRVDRIALLGFLVDPGVLDAVFVVNLAVLIYRLVAIVDAYRVAQYLNNSAASGAGQAGRARIPGNLASIAGLLAVILVMTGSHAVVARYDLLAKDVLDSGCIFIGDDNKTCDLDTTPSPSPGDTGQPSQDASALPTDSPEPEATPTGSALPEVAIPPWDGKERLNILLIGADQRPSEGTFNTDTLIVVSIDPLTHKVAMFSLPRDTVDVPTPPGPARNAFGPLYTRKINAWWTSIHLRSDLFPGNKKTRGYNGLKEILGNLYKLDIKYFVEVNFDGFRSIVDEMGGVTINVQVPVSDDRFPSTEGRLRRVYIPSGIQHMNGAEALRYARSRHGSNDFDRGVRQQRVLLSLREQADPQALIPRLPELVKALQKAVSTDIPANQLAPLLGLASQIDTKNIRSYVFSPPLLPEGIPEQSARLHHRPERPADPCRRQGRLHRGPGRGGQPPGSRRRGGRGMGPQRHQRQRPRGAPRRLPRLPRDGCIRAAPEAARPGPGEHDDRRLQRRRDREPRDHRLPRADVRGDRHAGDRSGHRDGHHRHHREGDTRPRGAALVLTRPYSIGVSQWSYSGMRPRTASK